MTKDEVKQYFIGRYHPSYIEVNLDRKCRVADGSLVHVVQMAFDRCSIWHRIVCDDKLELFDYHDTVGIPRLVFEQYFDVVSSMYSDADLELERLKGILDVKLAGYDVVDISRLDKDEIPVVDRFDNFSFRVKFKHRYGTKVYTNGAADLFLVERLHDSSIAVLGQHGVPLEKLLKFLEAEKALDMVKALENL